MAEQFESKKIFDAVISAVRASDKNLEASTKWGKLTFSFKGDFHHWICAISPTKKSVNLIFHFGGLLTDKKKAFKSGESFFLRKLEYKSLNEVNPAIINDFVNQAINKLDYFRLNWKELNKQSKADKKTP